jgi:choline dehydrogenase-like flavoprotein
LFDAIVVGSGPAGTSAALALRGTRVLVLDVGYTAPGAPDIEGNIYTVRRQREDLFHELIGESFEGLRNIAGRKISLKLKSPYTSYVIRDGERLCPLASENFDGVVSFAQGGLANAWGAGVYRFNDRELSEFPITAADLAPFFDELTSHIGISGSNDELAAYFGSDSSLLPPIRISAVAREILSAYHSRTGFFHARGIRMGLPRLAVLTRPHHGRPAYGYDNLEFFKPYNPAIYNPVFTLDELVAAGEVEFRRGCLVTRFEDRSSHVDVVARNLAAGQEEVFQARKLLLAAGTLSTTRIVLAARGDTTTRLPILDNPMCCIPLIRLARIGSSLDVNDSSLAQLNVVCEDGALSEPVQASIYGTTGPLRSDVLFEFPLAVSAGLVWARYLPPAMALMMLFYPGQPDPRNYIRLRPGGELEVNYEWRTPGTAERKLIAAFRRIGYLSSMKLCQYPGMGASLHYAGTLPMRQSPGAYETHPDGRLEGTRNVHVCDGACFSALPSKNLTFTIMANSMRIARALRREFS